MVLINRQAKVAIPTCGGSSAVGHGSGGSSVASNGSVSYGSGVGNGGGSSSSGRVSRINISSISSSGVIHSSGIGNGVVGDRGAGSTSGVVDGGRCGGCRLVIVAGALVWRADPHRTVGSAPGVHRLGDAVARCLCLWF